MQQLWPPGAGLHSRRCRQSLQHNSNQQLDRDLHSRVYEEALAGSPSSYLQVDLETLSACIWHCEKLLRMSEQA